MNKLLVSQEGFRSLEIVKWTSCFKSLNQGWSFCKVCANFETKFLFQNEIFRTGKRSYIGFMCLSPFYLVRTYSLLLQSAHCKIYIISPPYKDFLEILFIIHLVKNVPVMGSWSISESYSESCMISSFHGE